MKILVLSDSHSALQFMEQCVEKVRPDVIIHLGDFVRDGEELSARYSDIRMIQVAGNCDRYRVTADYPETFVETIGGVRIFGTHGHLHGVKLYTDRLAADARRCNAKIALYGHTHQQDCHREEDGLWVVNPGSAGNYGGTAALITILAPDDFFCSNIRQRDMEEYQ